MRYPPRYSNGWAEFWSEPMKPLVNKLNHAHWLRISYHDYSVLGLSSQQCSGIPEKLLCLFSSILVHYKNFSRQSLIKVPNQSSTHMTFSHKIQAKTFTRPDMSFYARQVTLMCQTKESNKHAPGWVVIYISVHSVLVYTLAFINVLLVLALNFMVHKSSYCKCSLAWCQGRIFLLFTIWTHPLQMREYPLQYAGTGRNKKSHYNKVHTHIRLCLSGNCV